MDNGDSPATAITVEPTRAVVEQATGVGMLPPAPAIHLGLTKREAFAMAAMDGLLASGAIESYLNSLSDEQIESLDWSTESRVSLMSVSIANGLLAALEESK